MGGSPKEKDMSLSARRWTCKAKVWHWSPDLWWRFFLPKKFHEASLTKWLFWTITEQTRVFGFRWHWDLTQWWEFVLPQRQFHTMQTKWLFWLIDRKLR